MRALRAFISPHNPSISWFNTGEKGSGSNFLAKTFVKKIKSVFGLLLPACLYAKPVNLEAKRVYWDPGNHHRRLGGGGMRVWKCGYICACVFVGGWLQVCLCFYFPPPSLFGKIQKPILLIIPSFLCRKWTCRMSDCCTGNRLVRARFTALWWKTVQRIKAQYQVLLIT